jgi:toxin HigB-1
LAAIYAVNAGGNWRITFGWIEGDAIDVDLEDYHLRTE